MRRVIFHIVINVSQHERVAGMLIKWDVREGGHLERIELTLMLLPALQQSLLSLSLLLQQLSSKVEGLSQQADF